MSTILIDVSKHQGTIDWERTASELKRVNGGRAGGAILRVGYSTNYGGLVIDPQFENNANGCERYGVPYGAYFYSYDHSANASKISAGAAAKAIGNRCLEYPIFIDVEYETFNINASKETNTAIIHSALTELERLGFFAGVYCSRDFFLNHTNLKSLLRYTLWEAAYTKSDTGAIANDMWQYSSKNAAGIAGFGNSLDCNICYRDFPAIIRNCGLNNFGKPAQAETVDWSSESDWFKIQCSKGDRPALKEVCEAKKLPVFNL